MLTGYHCSYETINYDSYNNRYNSKYFIEDNEKLKLVDDGSTNLETFKMFIEAIRNGE